MNTQQPHAPRPDPLIDEVRDIRRELSERFGNDVTKLAQHLREIERQHAHRIVRPNPDVLMPKGR